MTPHEQLLDSINKLSLEKAELEKENDKLQALVGKTPSVWRKEFEDLEEQNAGLKFELDASREALKEAMKVVVLAQSRFLVCVGALKKYRHISVSYEYKEPFNYANEALTALEAKDKDA